MALGRQTWTLIVKNLTIAAVRNGLSTIIRAFFLPFILILFISNARHIFTPPQQYGIGVATPVRNLTNSFQATTDGRRTLVFVNSGYQNGEIARVIETVAAPARAQNMDVQIIQQESTLLGICRGSLSGVGPCFGAAVFHSSPSEPSSGGQWNYTLHMDDVLGRTIFTNQVDNPAEIYLIPLQQAIDFAIAGVDQTGQATPSMAVDEYPYTMLTEAQWNDQNRVSFMDTVINLLGAAFFAGMVGVSYQLVGFMVSEREMGMTQLLEAMMPNTRTWQPQFARLASLHVAYSLMYLPGWIIIGVLLGLEVFTNTSMAIVIVYHFLAGLALTSFSIFGAAFFKKAQMSGNSVTMIMLLLAILAQVVAKSTSDVAIGVLGLVFPPMNYIFFLVLMARWERQDIGTNLVQTAPGNPWSLPGVALWVFLAVQIILYPILGALVERSLHGISTKGRSVTMDARDNDRVRLRRFSKRFQPSWFSRLISPLSGSRRETVVAVNDVSFTAQKGQILVLLGANGSGKTTILNAITGLTNISQGNVKVGTRDGIGYTPQKNVLWEELTVEEHVTIFNRIKSTDKIASKETIRALIKTCDIESKLEAMSKTLSGGQKRKLQLAMMFTGGSSVCCVDEVTSGLDPLSRRKVWDILLAERGRRTIIMTTHFLDEAGLLADHIVILSKGSLCVEGSAVDLTNALGGGYRVLVETSSGGPVAPHFSDVPRTDAHGLATYSVPDSAAAAELIRRLDARGVAEFEVKGPTIEDVFLNIADTTGALTSPQKHIGRPRLLSTSKGSSDVQTTESNDSEDQGLVLSHGKRIGVGRQAWVLLQKRLTVLRRNGMPHLFAFIVPIIAAGLVTLLLRGYSDPGCSLAELAQPATTMSFTTEDSVEFVVGPSSKFTGDALSSLQNLITGNSASGHNRTINLVNTRAEFQAYISLNSSTVSPGGFFIDDLPIFAYEGSDGIYKAMLVQNALDTQLTNTSIAAQYASFDVLVAPNSIDVLQLVIYFGLVMAICPAFFALYPTFERLQGIRGLEYSNGIRPLPLWLAYLFFDFAISVVMSGIIVGIFVATSSVWYNIGYLFLVLVLYSTVSILLSYIVSKIATSQLAAFATMASLQSLMVSLRWCFPDLFANLSL
jgi:ATP-binding cassette subfamily A (ABC1) protein 3